MSDEKLSQEEIDALLRQGAAQPDEGSTGDAGETGPEINSYLSPMEQDAIGEIGNISFGNASTVLSQLLNQKVDITTPKVSLLRKENLVDEFPKPHIAVHVKYTEGFEGLNLLVIKMEDAKIIADLMLGGDGTNPDPELNEMHLSAVQEAMNQMMGSAATSLSTMFSRKVDISPPGIDIFDLVNDKYEHPVIEEDILLKISFKMRVGDLIDSEFMQLVPIPFSKEMVNALLQGGAQEETAAPQEAQQDKGPGAEQVGPSRPDAASQPPVPQLPNRQKQVDELSQSVRSSAGQGMEREEYRLRNKETPVVQPVEFTEFDRQAGQMEQALPENLELLMDIPLQVTVELGRTKRTVQEILELAPGSVVELDKLAGEPVDILVNNKLIAKGEVVVIEENFGIRVTEILSQWDRLQKL